MKVAFLLLSIAISLSVTGQQKSQPIRIGQTVPEITFHNVLNSGKKKMKLSDFKGKLVILDMWSTTCGTCIALFPKMQLLQSKFKGKLQILLVNSRVNKYDTEERIKQVLQKQKERTGFDLTLPIPIHDTLIDYYFPHITFPNYVWIGPDRKLLAITRAQDVTEENITKILEGQKIELPVKDDWAYDRNIPLLVDSNGGGSGDFLFRTLITGYNKNIGGGGGLRTDSNGNIIGIYSINKPLYALISAAYPTILSNRQSSRIVFNVNNTSKYNHDPPQQELYCYDITIPATSPKDFKVDNFLKEDLHRFFNINVSIERRKVKCLIVTKGSDYVNTASMYEKTETLTYDTAAIYNYKHGYTIGEIIKDFDGGTFGMPLVDETGVSNETIDLELNKENASESWQSVVLRALRKAGFELKEAEREIEFAVITDK